MRTSTVSKVTSTVSDFWKSTSCVLRVSMKDLMRTSINSILVLMARGLGWNRLLTSAISSATSRLCELVGGCPVAGADGVDGSTEGEDGEGKRGAEDDEGAHDDAGEEERQEPTA